MSKLRTDVSALYIDPRGPYPKLLADCWDEVRDAKLYAGPNPVVAHPPCGPWGNLAHFCTSQDADCAHIAVGQVRQWGGVLEHPESSRLFDEFGLDRDGVGKVWYVEQGAFGHVAQKRTKLYTVGIASSAIWARTLRARDTGRLVANLSKEARRRTPLAFAEWLIELAAGARRTEAA